MDLGFVSLNTPRDIAPGVLGPELESRGFESMWVGEHPQIPVSAKDHFPAGLLGAQKRMWDPFLSLLAAAQATTDLRVGTAVVLPLERELFTLAKEVATLDQMSGGRLLLGVGVGFRAELELSRSIDWSDRYRALGDMVAALDVAVDRRRAGIPRRVLRLRPGVVVPKAPPATAPAAPGRRHRSQGDARLPGLDRWLAPRRRRVQGCGEPRWLTSAGRPRKPAATPRRWISRSWRGATPRWRCWRPTGTSASTAPWWAEGGATAMIRRRRCRSSTGMQRWSTSFVDRRPTLRSDRAPARVDRFVVWHPDAG